MRLIYHNKFQDRDCIINNYKCSKPYLKVEYSRSVNTAYFLISFVTLIGVLSMFITDWFNTRLYLPPDRNPSFQFTACEERYSLWQFCIGYCNQLTGEFRWECDSWSSYIDMVGGISNINWKTPIPFAITVSRVFISLLFILLFCQHFAIYVRSRLIRIVFITNLILSYGLWITMYTWNILESTDRGIPNAAFPGAVSNYNK